MGDVEVIRRTPSAKFLRGHVEYAYFDEELWKILQCEAQAKQLLEVLTQLIVTV